ncbi:MAG TPA: hypothetical protein VG982_01215 [Candidatus Paceibacterota bacterium]|nr:hypothetical protein [Candidatus Paceibacterota bacterium]
MFWIIPLSFLIIFELIADVFSKEYALKGTWQFWALAILGYIIANIFWLWGIRSGSGLARGAIIFSVGSAIFATIIGIHFFGEKESFLQYVGIVLGILSLICILWP